MKVFRKQRQQLAADNLPVRQAGNIVKYLRYAIGKIALVVVVTLITTQKNY